MRGKLTITGIDHVAIVTADLERSRRFYRKLGLKLTKTFDVAEKFPEDPEPHRYYAAAVLFGNRAPVLWIMQPTDRSGPLSRFLDHQGPGLHHIGLKTDDTANDESKLERKNIEFARRAMRDGREIRAIIDPHHSEKVLIELVQRLPKD